MSLFAKIFTFSTTIVHKLLPLGSPNFTHKVPIYSHLRKHMHHGNSFTPQKLLNFIGGLVETFVTFGTIFTFSTTIVHKLLHLASPNFTHKVPIYSPLRKHMHHGNSFTPQTITQLFRWLGRKFCHFSQKFSNFPARLCINHYT